MHSKSSVSQSKQEPQSKPYLTNPVRKHDFKHIINSKENIIRKRNKKFSLERCNKFTTVDNADKASSFHTNSQYTSSAARSRQQMYTLDLGSFQKDYGEANSQANANHLGMPRKSLPLNQRLQQTPEHKHKPKGNFETKISILENIGTYEKENRTLLKSNILSIRNMFENELTLDISLVNEYGKDSENSQKGSSKEEEIKKFLRDSSISIEKLQTQLNKITKESKDSQTICNFMGIKTKDDALRICYETIRYIEVLWNQMIALETSLIYKCNHKIESNHFSKTMVSELDSSFKGFESFFRNRTLSYKKIMEKVTKILDGDLPSKSLADTHNLSRSIHQLKSISDLRHHNLDPIHPGRDDFGRSSHIMVPNKLSLGVESYKAKLEPISKSVDKRATPLKKAKKISFKNKSYKTIKKAIDYCQGRICTNEFLSSILGYVESNFQTFPDMQESIKDKQEECDILKSRCELLEKHVTESESLNKHLTNEIERYQTLCENNLKEDSSTSIKLITENLNSPELTKIQSTKSSIEKLEVDKFTSAKKDLKDSKPKKLKFSKMGKPIKLKLKNGSSVLKNYKNI
ncbi:unnamed protein product [Moneuplotes crassus]|uniref:Uncharacterized protein n=1 Tax=Euplotes crassus TaxID=5936 RepID=A0AAD1U487_EUPCR|nr:unnamed protein product [Moneuplotes crassus]